MKSHHVAICDDFLAYAKLLREPRIRVKFLQRGLAHLTEEKKHLGQRQRLLAKPAILDIRASLKFDRWGLYPKLGDSCLSSTQYLDVRIGLIQSEIKTAEMEGFPMLHPSPVQLAVRDIWSQHGVAAVLPFIQACWKDGLILKLDDYFLAMYTAARSEAFGLEWQQCWEEMVHADSQASKDSTSGGLSILSRARRMADIDAGFARDPRALETIARREYQSVEISLTKAKRRPFSSFLREVLVLKPVYYSLRDIWYELHFLAIEPEERSEFEYLESLVDEMQADIGQMVLHPLGGPILGDILQWDGRTVAHCRRRLDFWEHSRVQLNHAIAQKIRARLGLFRGRCNGYALRQELQSLLIKSLSEGQRVAMQMLDTELSSAIEGQIHERAQVPVRPT
jgi:hypothetical protein